MWGSLCPVKPIYRIFPARCERRRTGCGQEQSRFHIRGDQHLSNRSPLATAGEPPTTRAPTGKRAQCCDRTSRGDARRTARGETKEDEVSRHVRCENVAETQKADRINQAGHDRQADQRSNKRSLIIHDALNRVHEISSHCLSVVYGMRSCSRCGSSPSHAGFCAVPSKMDEVLKGSNSPRAAAVAVLDSNAVNSGSVKGRNVRAASQA